jgi:hypothetical protein
MTILIDSDHFEALTAAISAATLRVESDFLMARSTVRDTDIAGTHIYSRDEAQRFSLCGNLIRAHRVLHSPRSYRLHLGEVTCLACLNNFATEMRKAAIR